jgi:hypothetical protein
MSLRISDTNAESQVAMFLDKHFYPNHYPTYRRIFEKEAQLKGIDTIISVPIFGDKFCDEKAAIHYVNKGLPTFAFELDFKLNDGRLVEGWFLSKEKKTEYYLLVWIWSLKEKGFTYDDITKIEVILISRNKIISELSKIGMNPDLIKQKSIEIRKNSQSGVIEKLYNKPFYFYLTTHLQENPLNIILKKDFLIKNCILHKFITK